jgi:hypothetical protein
MADTSKERRSRIGSLRPEGAGGSISYERINKVKVRPVQTGASLTMDKIRGSDLFPEIYCNVFICARKKSGKSSLIWKILKESVGRDTKIVIFAATARKDATYKHIIDYFEKKGNDVEVYLSITDGKEDRLSTIIEGLLTQEPPEEQSEEPPPPPPPNPFKFGTEEEEEKKKRPPRKETKLAPEIIFVFDDLSSELRAKSVTSLMKSNRHYKSKVILSSQWPNDLEPSALKQLDYCILFGGHERKKLEKLHTDLDLKIKLEDFIAMFREITKAQYNFLYIDVINECFRKNFNQLICNRELVLD